MHPQVSAMILKRRKLGKLSAPIEMEAVLNLLLLRPAILTHDMQAKEEQNANSAATTLDNKPSSGAGLGAKEANNLRSCAKLKVSDLSQIR
jgi:hypothetical protein